MAPFQMGFGRDQQSGSGGEVEADPPFSLGSRRIEAAIAGGPLNDLVEVRVFEWEGGSFDDMVREVEEYDPQLIGLSVYIWSLPTLLAVAHRLKQTDPRRVVVAGGPSARPVMLGHEPFRPYATCLDAVCLGEGEPPITGIVHAMLDGRPFSSVPGLSLPTSLGTWKNTAEADPADLNELPSAYVLGRARPGVGYIETYRGCPLSCSFCEWGVISANRPPLSADNIVADFEALDAAGCRGIFLVDAALNLNPKAFRNLFEAEERTDFLSRRFMHCEVYPGRVNDDHLAFLKKVRANVGLGLQSIHSAVLDDVDRPFRKKGLHQSVERLSSVADVWVELIVGLPGDSLEGFKQTLDAVKELPVRTRTFHCLALPDGLMTRAKPEDNLVYDPISLEVSSCRGWPPGDIDKAIQLMKDLGHEDARRFDSGWEEVAGPYRIDDYLGKAVLSGSWCETVGPRGGAHQQARH